MQVMLYLRNLKLHVKVRKKATIRNQYNQAPHLTQDTTWESKKAHNKTSHTREPRGQPFPQCVLNIVNDVVFLLSFQSYKNESKIKVRLSTLIIL